MRNILRVTSVSCLVVAAGLTGCSSKASSAVESHGTSQVHVIKAPGVVEYVWEEPMVDVVDVPPGLDPEGTYYRPGHQSIVEIRQGRWRYYKEGQDKD